MGWNPDLLMHLDMDGPSVNLKFQEDLEKKFWINNWWKILEWGHLFLKLGTYVFQERSVCSFSYIAQFAMDLHGFFKLSAARRKDYVIKWWH